MQFDNISGSVSVGQATPISVSSSSGQTVTWSSSSGSSFSPASSSVDANGNASTTYTPSVAGDDNLTATDDTGATASGMIPVQASGGGGGGGGGGGSLPSAAAAQAALAALLADPNYCSNVGISGTAVNTTIHAFKVAWNADVPSQALAFNGQYDDACASALAQALGGNVSVPSACQASPPPPPPPPPPGPIQPASSGGLALWAKVLIGVLIAGGIGAIIWAFTHKPRSGSSSSMSESRRPHKKRPRKKGKKKSRR